jgi:hypothetical protein
MSGLLTGATTTVSATTTNNSGANSITRAMGLSARIATRRSSLSKSAPLLQFTSILTDCRGTSSNLCRIQGSGLGADRACNFSTAHESNE